jgi:hypothetical protein
MKITLANILFILLTSAFASSGTDFLLNRYGERLPELCDGEYLSHAYSLTELDVRQPYCIFYEQKLDKFQEDLERVFYQQFGKAFKDVGGQRSIAFADGTIFSFNLYTNMDDTEGEIHWYGRGQGTYIIIFQSY